MEFWQEEDARQKLDMRRLLLRFLLVFAVFLVSIVMVNWWAGAAVQFSASRTEGSTPARYRVFGRVIDARTGEPVPWAVVGDDPTGNPPVFQSSADQNGTYELMTVAEPHRLIVSALGYRSGAPLVGKPWYLWAPSGTERLDIRLEPE